MFPKVPNGEVCSSWENDNEPAAEIVTTMLELTVDSTTSCNVLKQVRSDLCAFSAKQPWLIFLFLFEESRGSAQHKCSWNRPGRNVYRPGRRASLSVYVHPTTDAVRSLHDEGSSWNLDLVERCFRDTESMIMPRTGPHEVNIE